MESRCKQALDSIPSSIASLPRILRSADGGRINGSRDVKEAWETRNGAAEATKPETCRWGDSPGTLSSLIDEIEMSGNGVVLAMGKGGVGKTTVAASIAVALADRGHEVLLSTTDPAAHLSATMATDTLANLTISRIDPAQETAEYTAEVMQTAGARAR